MPSPLEIVQLYGGGKPVAAFARTRGGHAVPPAFWRTRPRATTSTKLDDLFLVECAALCGGRLDACATTAGHQYRRN
jgi:hypothetical protein